MCIAFIHFWKVWHLLNNKQKFWVIKEFVFAVNLPVNVQSFQPVADKSRSTNSSRYVFETEGEFRQR